MLLRGQWNYKGVSNSIYGMDEFDRANTDMEQKLKSFIKTLGCYTDF